MKLLFYLSIFFLFFMSLFGSLLFSILLHEMQHQKDFFDSIVQDEEICLFNVQTNGNIFERITNFNGYYSFRSETAVLEEIKVYSEFKAYLLSFLVIILFFLSGYYFFKKQKIYSTSFPTT